MEATDIIVIGAGIVGLATAYELARRHPNGRVLVLEKEAEPGQHQSSRNSGVLHSGVYYRPGSLKATTCREGCLAMEAFCSEHEVPFERCGKVIVATQDDELPALERIYERGQANGVTCTRLTADELRNMEPHASGIAALHVADAGIVDFPGVCSKLAALLMEQGHRVLFGQSVSAIEAGDDQVTVRTGQQEYVAACAVNCSGLHSDRLVRMSGLEPEVRIVPFRGEYFVLKAGARHLCRNLIYPVPDPAFPFLGVHFTRMIDGSVECGPNAVPALGREAYDKAGMCWRDVAETLGYAGARRLMLKHWRMGMGEIWRSLSKPAFVKALQRLVPAIRPEHLVAAPPGIRAQAVARDGSLVDDFVIQKAGRVVHVCNAPSPAATASLKIAERICDELVL